LKACFEEQAANMEDQRITQT